MFAVVLKSTNYHCCGSYEKPESSSLNVWVGQQFEFQGFLNVLSLILVKANKANSVFKSVKVISLLWPVGGVFGLSHIIYMSYVHSVISHTDFCMIIGCVDSTCCWVWCQVVCSPVQSFTFRVTGVTKSNRTNKRPWFVQMWNISYQTVGWGWGGWRGAEASLSSRSPSDLPSHWKMSTEKKTVPVKRGVLHQVFSVITSANRPCIRRLIMKSTSMVLISFETV